jgi:MYXO-CTERM domain-containing protein
MKKIAAIFCLMGTASFTKADLIAYWNFNTSTSVSGGTESGTATLDTSMANASLNGSGTSLNHVGTDGDGTPLEIAAGTTVGENGQYITFSLSMSSYQNLVLTYASARGTTGFTSENWSYSNDDTTFNPLASNTSIPTYGASSASYGTTPVTINFSSATTLNGDPSIWIRLTLNGATATSGADRFDNIQFNASPVPEPGTWGAISGAGLLGLCGVRAWRQRRQQNAAV